MNYTITEIATIVKAQKRAYKDYTITALLTDSRSLTFPEETLFFALVTERRSPLHQRSLPKRSTKLRGRTSGSR